MMFRHREGHQVGGDLLRVRPSPRRPHWRTASLTATRAETHKQIAAQLQGYPTVPGSKFYDGLAPGRPSSWGGRALRAANSPSPTLENRKLDSHTGRNTQINSSATPRVPNGVRQTPGPKHTNK